MSVRIHQLAKRIGADPKQLIHLLRSRGFAVHSASSTLDNISASAIEEEFSDSNAKLKLIGENNYDLKRDNEKAISTPLSAEKIEERVKNGNRFTTEEMSCETTKERVRLARINKRERLGEVGKPINSTASNQTNPFANKDARDWLAKVLWRHNFPEFENNIILIGDGPFKVEELHSFLKRWKVGCELIGEQPEDDGYDSGHWSYSNTAHSPVFVFGADEAKAYELESLLSDKTCIDKPMSGDRSVLTYWLGQYLDDNGRSVFFRSKNLRNATLISQEMLLAHLFADYVEPTELGPIWLKQKASHTLLGNIEEIKLGANHASTFSWPSTTAERGVGNVEGDEWPKIGLLKYMGYAVGANGESISKRREILASTYELAVLPNIDSPEYIRSWGNSNCAARLKKMADAIAAFVRNQKRKSYPSYEAINDWEEDLNWLKKTYYTGRYDYKFNWPNTGN